MLPSERKTRRFSFKANIEYQNGYVQEYTKVYDVTLEKWEDSRFVHVLIRPDFGKQIRGKIVDCAITWKSLLYAYRMCAKDAGLEVEAWAETDFEADGDGSLVIPVNELSTGKRKGAV